MLCFAGCLKRTKVRTTSSDSWIPLDALLVLAASSPMEGSTQRMGGAGAKARHCRECRRPVHRAPRVATEPLVARSAIFVVAAISWANLSAGVLGLKSQAGKALRGVRTPAASRAELCKPSSEGGGEAAFATQACVASNLTPRCRDSW